MLIFRKHAQVPEEQLLEKRRPQKDPASDIQFEKGEFQKQQRLVSSKHRPPEKDNFVGFHP